MTDRSRRCVRWLRTLESLPGDIIELGVGGGATTAQLAKAAPARTVLACDTFTGIPTNRGPNDGDSRALTKGRFRYGVSPLLRRMAAVGANNVRIIRGPIEKTLPRLNGRALCFAWIDLDLYEPTRIAWEFCRERIVPGGIVGFHDYGFALTPGIAKVVDTIDWPRIECELTSVFFRRPH